MEIQTVLLVLNLTITIIYFSLFIKGRKKKKECDSLLAEIEKKQGEEIEWNQQLTDKLCQKSYNDGYQEGFQNGRMQGKKKHRKR